MTDHSEQHGTHHKSTFTRSVVTAFMAASMFGGMFIGSNSHSGPAEHMPHTNREEVVERRRKNLVDAQKSKTAKRDVGLGGAVETTEEIYSSDEYTMLRSEQHILPNDQTHASLDIHPRYTVVASAAAKATHPAI